MSAATNKAPDKQLVDLILAHRALEAIAISESRPDLGKEGYKIAYEAATEIRNANRQTNPARSDDEWLDAVLSEDEPAKKPKRRSHKPRPVREPRIKWRYYPFPTAIWDDSDLPANAKLAAGMIARSVNLGPWNTDLHADLRYAAFGFGSIDTAERAVKALKDAGYIKTESLNRGGVRYWFTEKATDKQPTETE